MEKKSLAGLCFLFLVLFVAQEVMVQTEAKTCENLANTYRGPCFTTGSCDDHCKNKEHLRSAGAGTISGVGAPETVNRILPNPNKRACRAFYK